MKKKRDFVPFNLVWCLTSFIFPFIIFWNDLNLLQLSVISFIVYYLDVNNNVTEDYLQYRLKTINDKYDSFVRSIVMEKYKEYREEYWIRNPNPIGRPMSYEDWFKSNYENKS